MEGEGGSPHGTPPILFVPAQRTSFLRKRARTITVATTGLVLIAIGCVALAWNTGSGSVPAPSLLELQDTASGGVSDSVVTQDEHAEPSAEDMSIYNPSSDPDAPSAPHGPSGRLKLQKGLEKVLQQAASTNALAMSTRLSKPNVVAKPSEIYNPARDPDAPTDKFSRFMNSEQQNLEKAAKMKKRLKLEAKVAMLSSRETTTLAALKPKVVDTKQGNARDKDEKQHEKDKGVWPKAKHTYDWFKGPPKRPGLKEITANVERELEKGDDPDALLKKEKKLEDQYQREAKAYAQWQATGPDDDRR